nr:MAG TPA: hypothetical protein [Caudoviricetes sp.]
MTEWLNYFYIWYRKLTYRAGRRKRGGIPLRIGW